MSLSSPVSLGTGVPPINIMSLITAFKIDFDVTILDYDFSSLKKETRIHQDNLTFKSKEEWLKLRPYMRVLEKPEHHQIRDNLNKHVNDFMRNTYKFGNQEGTNEYVEQEFIITTSWLARLDEGQDRINKHRHTCAFWSGVLYYDDKYHWDATPLEFESPIPWSSFDFNSPTFSRHLQIKPQTGLCILFPADIVHYTDKIKKGEVRRSLAFNILPKGLTGVSTSDSHYHPSWLI
tara:strand:- start:1070 stop:1771 length:702 start_codon:yes stop_codon:yes gene_type:complete